MLLPIQLNFLKFHPNTGRSLKTRCFIKYLFFCLISFSGKLSGQHFIVSPESIDDPGFEHVKVLGQEEEGFYLLQSNLSLQIQRDRVGFRNRKYKIGFFNAALQQKWEKKLEEANDQRNIDLVVMFNGRPIIITSEWKKSENLITFYADVLNNKGNSFIKEKKIGTISYTKGSDLEKPRFVISHNNLNAVIVVEEDRDKDQVLHLMMLDSSLTMNMLYSPVINYPSKQFEVTNVVLSDANDFAAIAQGTEKNQNGQKGKTTKYKLFLKRSGESFFDESTISSGDKNITEAALTADNINNKIVVAGFYNDNESFAGTGILFVSWNLKNKTPMEIKSVSIDDNVRIKMIGERNSGANIGMYSYPIRKMILRSDGGAVVIAEAAYYSEYSYFDYFTQSFTRRTEYHYDNVIIMSIHTNGTIDWSGVLHKSQESMDDGGFLSSFCSILESDRIDLVYNNDISRNNEIENFSISNKGETEQKKVSRSSDHLTLIPHSGEQVDENTLIVAAIMKKKLYLLKLEF